MASAVPVWHPVKKSQVPVPQHLIYDRLVAKVLVDVHDTVVPDNLSRGSSMK